MSCIKIPAVQTDLPSRIMEQNDNLFSVSDKNSKLIKSANKVFKNTWSHSVTNSTIDFIDSSAGKFFVGCKATVRVQLSNGIFHEDIGYGNADAPSKGLAVEKATLTSVTNALTKVLSCFPEMEQEMQNFHSRQTSNIKQNLTSNISSIMKTVASIKRPITPPPHAQSTPKVARNATTIEKLRGNKIKNTDITSDDMKLSETYDVNKVDSEVDNLDEIFESAVILPTHSVPSVSTSSSTLTNAPSAEEELRLERKRKQREKQEEFKRLMRDKEDKDLHNVREVQKPNPKF